MEIANQTTIGDTIIVDIDRNGVYMTIHVIMGYKVKEVIMWQPCCDMVESNNAIESKLLLFPNPTPDIAKFQFSSSRKEEIQFFLTDATGRIILDRKITDFKGFHQGQLDLGNFAAGLYFFTVIQGNQRISERLVLQKL